MKVRTILVGGALSSTVLLLGFQLYAEKADAPVYELRTYTAAEGRLPDLHRRFSDHTIRLFEKHGMTNVIYWTPTEKENTLVYVLSHKSEAAAKQSWKAFMADPDWQSAYKASTSNGRLVAKVEKQFLVPTDYSPRK